jgi:hypothetical protein
MAPTFYKRNLEIAMPEAHSLANGGISRISSRLSRQKCGGNWFQILLCKRNMLALERSQGSQRNPHLNRSTCLKMLMEEGWEAHALQMEPFL